MAADAYRQVSYLNDTTYENTQVLVEYAVNGSLGSTTTAYSFGVQRESFVETTAGMGAGVTIGGMTYQSSGTYYYTGTGSVANVTGSATNQSYSYTASGSMTAYAMNASAENETSTLTTNPTAYGTYGVYGYNGEYTHTSLGLQYLRARYLNVATGTFTSRDTYAGRLQDILSQNRYTFAENNPIGHSDPSGHAPKKSGIGTILGRLGNTLKTSITGKNTGTSERARAATANSINNYIRDQRNRVSNNDFSNFVKAGLGINLTGVTTNLGIEDTWIGRVASQIEIKKCQAYQYCINKEQTVIKDRLRNGAELFGKGTFEAFAGATFMVTGLIYPTAFIPGAFELVASVSDISQGMQELEYGWNGDATSESVNFLQDTVFLGEKELYETITNIVTSIGLLLFAGAGGAYKVTPVQNASALRSSAVPVTLGGKAATQTMGTTALTVQLTTQQPMQGTTPVVNNQQNLVEEGGTGERLIPGTEGVVTGGDSTKLGKNMMESMGLPRGTNWTGHQAQHIIPAEMANHPVLQRIGMDLDDASNGLFLRTPADDISAMSRHRGYHSTYNEFVRTQLDGIDINQSVDVLQKQVYDLQQNLKYLQQSGLPLYPSQGATVDLWQRSLERIQ